MKILVTEGGHDDYRFLGLFEIDDDIRKRVSEIETEIGKLGHQQLRIGRTPEGQARIVNIDKIVAGFKNEIRSLFLSGVPIEFEEENL